MVQPKRIGIAWIRYESGHYVGSMEGDREGRAVVNCTTLLSPPSLHPSEMLPLEEVTQEALVATVDIELLHRRLGHMERHVECVMLSVTRAQPRTVRGLLST